MDIKSVKPLTAKDGKQYVLVCVAFNRESDKWLDKLTIICHYAKLGHIYSFPVVHSRLTDKPVDRPYFYQDRDYARGIFKFALPFEMLEQYINKLNKVGLRYGPARKGDIPELDTIFSDLEDRHKPVSQAG